MKIVFTNTSNNSEIEKPKPASQFLPDWYKKTPSYFTGKKAPTDDGQTNSTVKKCMPVFDAITAGYIITSPADLYVEQVDGKPYYKWAAMSMIEFHGNVQTPGHPSKKTEDDTPKFINPWAVKTPKGYSCLFISPMHQDLPFTILPGVVDTDSYIRNVNFPFVMNDLTWEGMIPAGTPIAQVIPFKRHTWKMEFGSKKELEENLTQMNKMSLVFYDRYKKFWWNKKEYK